MQLYNTQLQPYVSRIVLSLHHRTMNALVHTLYFAEACNNFFSGKAVRYAAAEVLPY